MTRNKREIAYRTAGALILAAAVVPWATSGTAVAGGTPGNPTTCEAAGVQGSTIPSADITSNYTDGGYKLTITNVAPQWNVTAVIVKSSAGFETYLAADLGALPWDGLRGPGVQQNDGSWKKKKISGWYACGTPKSTQTPCPTATVTETATVTATQTVAGPTQTVTETVGGPTVTATERVTDTVTETQTATERVTDTVTATSTVEVPVTTTQTVAGPTETVTETATQTVEVPVTTTQTVTSTVEVPVTTTQTVTTPGPETTVTETITQSAPAPVTTTATVTVPPTTVTANSTQTATQTQTAIVSQTSSMQPGDESADPETSVLGNKIAGADDPSGVLAETGNDGMTQKLVLSAALLMLGFALFAAPELLGAARTTRARRH